MSLTSPYRQHNYMGECADDAAALTFIRASKWDSLGDGSGNPRNGMMYYNTTSHVLKVYANGSWITLGATSVVTMPSIIFWSEPSSVISISNGAADKTLPSVVIPNMTLGTFQRVVCLMKFRKAANTNASNANKLNGDQSIQVAESVAGSYVTCIDMKDDMIKVAAGATAESGGDVVVGDNDMKSSPITAVNKTYLFKWASAVADQANLEIHDIQTGIQIYFN